MEKDFYADSIVQDATPYYADEHRSPATEVKENYYNRNDVDPTGPVTAEPPTDRFHLLQTLHESIADMRQALNLLESLAVDMASNTPR